MNNAILLCGGIGRRMSPIPNCNKSLLPIRGEINLIRIINLLRRRGIDEIIIATNPLAESDIRKVIYDNLSEPSSIKIVVAEDYTPGCNNVVTLRVASDYIQNTYILETDQYYIEEKFNTLIEFEPLSKSYFFTQLRSSEDWGIISDMNFEVKKILHDNPDNQYFCLSGVSYITGETAEFLKSKLESCKDTSIYWEELLEEDPSLMSELCCNKYSIEYDNISDLVNNSLMDPKDIADLIDDNHQSIRLGSMTNTTYKVSLSGKDYALRIPGYGTERFIDHHREHRMEDSIPKSLKPDSQYFSNDAVKLTEYLEGYEVLKKVKDFPKVLNKLKILHKSSKNPKEFIDLEKEIWDYEDIYRGHISEYPRYDEIKHTVFCFLDKWFRNHTPERVHRDLVPLNIMIKGKDIKFIDWEYAGYLSKYWDLASLCCEFADEYHVDLSILIAIVSDQYPVDEEDLYRWVAVVDFVWAVWSLAKMHLGDDVEEYGLHRYNRAVSIIDSKMEEYL